MCAQWVGMNRDYADMLAMLPIFHGFGLGFVNAVLMNGESDPGSPLRSGAGGQD